MSIAKIPEWESELWHLISSGDGTHCPHIVDCKIRTSGEWCTDEYKGKFSDLLGEYVNECGKEALENYEREISRYSPSKWKCGRVFQLIEALANKYLEKAAVTEPPVNINIINYLETDKPVEIRPIPLKAYHGAVWKLDDCWLVHINKNDSPERQRINIFHEIFHVLTHCRTTPVFRKRGLSKGSFNEILADYFSSCLLMPEGWVKKKWAEEKDVKRMAKIFGVTNIGMWLRLKTTGLI